MPVTRRLPARLLAAYQRLPRRAKAVAACLCALLVVSAGYGGYMAEQQLFPGTCASGGSTYLRHEGPSGECIGYTNGGYIFDPSLAAAEHDIQRENQRVTAQHHTDYVSVVLLLPISAANGHADDDRA